MNPFARIKKLTFQDLNKNISLYLWIDKIRKLGSLLFIVGQDSSGKIQIVVKNAELVSKLKERKRGDLIGVWGVLKKKTDSEKEMELELTKYRLVNSSRELPFEIKDEININEDTRYHYRYLDLRRPNSKKFLVVKNQFLHELRNFLHKKGFIDVETPILAQNSPEGAKCFIVPSNLENRYYTLPQSAQIFKQLLMVSGFNRYYSMAKSFRNENARSNRQIEFSQLELEASFMPSYEIKELVEKLLKSILKKVFGYQIRAKFPTMTYQQVMEKYGTDKPDLRNGLEIQNFFDCHFFPNQKKNELIRGLYIPVSLSEKEIEELKEQLIKEEDKDLTGFIISGFEKVLFQNYLTLNEEKERNIIINQEQIKEFWASKVGNRSATLFVIKGKKEKIFSLLGRVRSILNNHFINEEKKYKFLWITDWPLFEYNQETKKYEPFRHPFTIPQKKYINPLLNGKIKPEQVICDAFDLVCNGEEVLSGSCRIYQRELQEKVLEILGYNHGERENNFGYFLQALEFAAPPHGGLGLGIDRLLAILLNANNLKELIAFPKNIDGTCSLTGAPNVLKS